MKRILLIEDEDVIRRALVRLLERRNYEVAAVADILSARAEAPRSFDIVLADIRLPGEDGTAIIPLADPVPVVMMTSHASVRSAVDAMRAGASDYIAKPFDHDELLLVLERALGRNLLGARNRALEHDQQRAEPALQRVDGTSLKALVDSLLSAQNGNADASCGMHLHGEPGSGREDVARCLHAFGHRADSPLLVLDAGAEGRPRNTEADGLDSLLGDDNQTGGLLRSVRGGSVVLRHPEFLSLDIQRRIVARVATDQLHLITIARTSADTLSQKDHIDPSLAALIAAHDHPVPPLRERRHDIPWLARRAATAIGQRHAGRSITLGKRALAALSARSWPGNIIELEALIAATIISLAPDRDPELDLELDEFVTVPTGQDELDLDAYFRYMVMRLQDELSETDLAARLGISRKALWERRQRMGLSRK